MSEIRAEEVKPGKWRWVKETPISHDESIGYWTSREEAEKAGREGQK